MSTQSENEPRSGAAGGATRVLLVEDEDALRRAYMRILTGHDLAVRDAGSALAALALLETETFDVVVSDIRMPDMDGIELLRAIRARSFDLPVILITGSPSIETAMQAVEFGALRYLTKPVTSGALIDAIEHGERLHRMARLKHQAAAEVGGEKPQPGDLASVEAGFRRALDSLWIAYQPIVSWSQRQIVAYEGLVRTKEPSIPHPGALFAAAERLDRLYELGRAIRAHIAETLDHGTTGCETYVNLHPRDLNDETLFESASPLARHAARIVLEITERATLDDVRDVASRVVRLREMGFRIAIDDLGAGYAGLSYFARLEPEVVKLDMSLIRHIDHELTKQRVVASMVSVSHELGMTVIAEGVETEGERDTAHALGCDLLQGYLFAKPAPPFPPATF